MKNIWEIRACEGSYKKELRRVLGESRRTIMRTIFALVTVLFGLCPQVAEGYRDHGSWMKTLHEKAVYFEKNTAERHNILGTYPSSVRLVPPMR